MTGEDAVYGDWLNLLGSDEITDSDPAIRDDLHRMHDRAEASHRDMDDYAAAQADAVLLGTEA